MYLLDSNILIYSARPEHSYLRDYITNEVNPCRVSVVTIVEVLGFHRITLEDKTYFNSCFALVQAIEVTNEITAKAVALRQGQRLSLGDAIIAATALVYNLELVTRNTSDFAGITQLRILNPFN